MRICKINDVKERVGEQITGVSGTLKSVFKVKSGVGTYGPWTLQDGVIADDTGEMGVTFANLSDMARLKGSLINITAKQGDKGITGLMVKKNEHEGKVYVKLHVTGSANIDAGVQHVNNDTPSTVAAPVQAPVIPADATDEERKALEDLAKARQAKADKLAQEAAAKARVQSEKPKGREFRKVQLINLYNEAVMAALWCAEKNHIDYCHEMVATLFIAFQDSNLVEGMPTELFGVVSSPVVETTTEGVQQDPPENIDQEQPTTWQEVRLHLEGPEKGIALGVLPNELLQKLYENFRPEKDPKTKNYSDKDLTLMGALKQWKTEAK